MIHPLVPLLEKECGYDVTTPSGSERLAYDIESKTGERLSRQTIQRITGVIETDGTPRRATMDIIARYLGFPDAPALNHFMTYGTSAFKRVPGLITINELEVGDTVELAWSPDRRLTLEYLDSGEMLVVSAENSKLAPGDRLTILQVMKGYPLLVKNVVRDGLSLGEYSAAPESGLTHVDVIPAAK